MSGSLPSQTSAQEGTTEVWSVPVNISHSGGATDPVFVIDANQIIHVIYEDINLGLMYSKIQEGILDAPIPIRAPFDQENINQLSDLKLVPDTLGRIHAFWINPRGELKYSLNQGGKNTNTSAWSFGPSLIEEGLDVDAATDLAGRMHLVYINAEDEDYMPAGVYYRSQEPGTINFSRPVLLYESPYYRSTGRDVANVRLVTAGTPEAPKLYAAWDNRLRLELYLTRSDDGGKTWQQPIVVDRPSADRPAAIPGNIRVAAHGDTAMVFWQILSSSEEDITCTQNYQWTSDGGKSWTRVQEYGVEYSTCPEENQLLTNSKGEYFLMTTVQEQVYLASWNGAEWSEPQIQDTLYSFQNPELYSLVQYNHKSSMIDYTDRLIVVGSDMGAGADIWLMYRSMQDSSSWFPQPSIWNDPILLTSQENRLNGLQALPDSQSHKHVFWSQAEASESLQTMSGQDTAIAYSAWDGQNWNRPFAVLRSPQGNAEQPAAAIDPEGRTYVVWSGGESGEIYFSWANTAQASSPLGWAPPLLISDPASLAVSPDIVVDRSGFIKVVYAIPINEQRGIYFVESRDYGATWSEPEQIFDGAAAGWEKVNNPKFTYAFNGVLHLIWSRYSLSSDVVGSGLVYARSESEGATWTDPEFVVEGPVSWTEIVGMGGQGVLRLWQETLGDQEGIKFQASSDGGVSWTTSDTIFTFNGASANSLGVDPNGQIYLAWGGRNNLSEQEIDLWKWEETKWIIEQGLKITPDLLSNLDQVAVVVVQPGELTLLYSGQAINEIDGLEENRLYASSRPIQLPPMPPTPTSRAPIPTEEILLLEATPTLAQTPTGIVTQTPAAIPPSKPITSDLTLVVLVIGSGMAILSVFFAILFRLLRTR